MSGAGTALRPAGFLDRDGTVIVDRHYLADPAGVELLPGAAEGIRRLNARGVPVILVTNQSGIGRGYFSPAEFDAVQARLVELLAAEGARLNAVYHCPHAPDAACECRKPGTALFQRAAAEHRLDLARSLFVGDRLRDVLPALRWGAQGVLLPGRGDPDPHPPEIGRAERLDEAVSRFLDGWAD